LLRQVNRLFIHLGGSDKAQKLTLLRDFDSAFYFQHHPDLFRLKTEKALKRHYLDHGLKEGRTKNLAEARKKLESSFGALPGDFDPNHYRVLNSDLIRIFDHDWQFTLHYLEHGRKEGRPYKSGVNERAEPWVSLFRLIDFVACADQWLGEPPATKEAAIRIFIDAGIERLAPINLHHIFDPTFYRAAYDFDERVPDVELYRHWLEKGVPQGWFANEANALADLLTSRNFPAAFDWRMYRSALPLAEAKPLRTRADVLQHLFNTGFEQGLTKHVFGSDADELFAAIGDYNLIRQRFPLAITAYDRALALNHAHVHARHRRGDAYLALGKSAAAHVDFSRAAASPHASVWSHIHAARTAAADGDFERSFHILVKARPKWIKSAPYRSTVKEVIEQYFAAKTRSAMTLYDAGDRDIADAYLLGTLDEVRERIEQLEDLPPIVAPAPDGHIAILANQDLAQCKHYRVEQKLRQLHHAGFETQLFDQHDVLAFIDSLLGARAALFYRVPAFPGIMRAILTAEALGIPTYYEIDDLIFDAPHYPDTLLSYEGQISKADYNGLLYGVPLFRYAMGLCDHGIASTTTLAAEIEPIVKSHRCLVLRNGLDDRNEKAIQIGAQGRPRRDTITIFYGSGTKAHNSDFNDLVGPAILSAMERNSTIRLVVVGYLSLRPEFERFSSRITRFDFVADLDEYWPLIAAADINLAVLSPGVMSDCKSEIKWLEAAILQVPSVVSGTATYKEILEDGVDALIVEDHAAWAAALDRLIEDYDLRCSIGAAARRKALQLYSIESGAELLRKELDVTKASGRDVIPSKDMRRQDGNSKMKVLVCHIFFPPQSYGGATRVVQDNVDYIKDQCPDIELSIFATDEGISSPGHFRFEDYRGTPVFRISTPTEPNMDWRPFNAGHEKLFARVLDTVQPDLVHFHCIQRLTASIVEVTLKRRIPYLVTVHDGWWISDYQFFVDQEGILRLPSSDAFDAAPPPGIQLIQSICRRQRLAGLLDGAAQVIAVSEAFAEIYRRAGCRNVIVIPNGVSPMARVPRQKQADGRLSLGHIGDRSAHKGARLVEAVLRTAHFNRLKLTMVDNTMEPGARCETVWGNTPVVLRGPCPQENVADLYASLDVLLAPSIWPESFGLVAREARAQDLWMVASNRGAIGECVKHGENGFLIDVSDGRALTEVLKMLDADVARYQATPPRDEAPMRTAVDQGREVAELYQKLHCGEGLSKGAVAEVVGI
jgi:glycosyltransferase involved in cell wall biosynthesis